MNLNRYLLLWLVAVTLLSHPRQSVAQQTTAFTYQGQLRDGGTNANGAYTMTFKLYDAASGGGQIGSTVTTSPTLANGLFSVNLDFGDEAFDGDARWLDITAQSGTNAPETLAPRVQVLPAPYALYAATADEAGQADEAFNANAVNGFQASSTPTQNKLLALGANGYFRPNGITLPSPNGDRSISADGQGILVDGVSISAAGITFPVSDRNRSITTSTNGIAIDGISIDGNTGITFPVGGSSITAAGNGDISIAGIAMSSANGLIFPTASVNRSINATDQGITVDGISIGGNTGIRFPIPGGTRTILAESQGITINGNVTATAFNTGSDRHLKEQFAAINSLDILERVVRLPISGWNFKHDATIRHIGPMAQDFYAAFGVGADEKHIATVDADGVALAAIQGLNEKLKEKDAQIEALEKRLADLEALIKSSTHK